jgi:hypothetical protein
MMSETLKSALILELNMPGQSHTMVNKAFVTRYSDKSDSISLVCMHEHFLALELSDLKNIKHKNFETLNFREILNKQKSKFRRFLTVFKNLYQLIKNEQTQNIDVLFLSVNEYELVSIFFLQKIFPKANFTAIIHGNLSQIKQKTGRNPYHRFFSYYHSIKRLTHPNIKLVVLEKWVKSNLDNQYPELTSNITVWPHPIDRIIHSEKTFDIKNVKIGIAGILSPSKNIESVIELEKIISEDNTIKDNMSVEYCMYMPKEHEGKLPKELPIKLQDDWLKNEQIEDFYKKIDFVIWFHGVDKYYQFSASGILLDAIKFGKPLIALSCEALTSVEKEFGQVSLNADTTKQIAQLLTTLTTTSYAQLKANLHTAQKARLNS